VAWQRLSYVQLLMILRTLITFTFNLTHRIQPCIDAAQL